MGKTHLDALALITRLEERLCPHQAARQIAGVLMKIAGDLSRRHVRAALHLEGADIAIKLGGAVPKHITFVHPASGVQHLVVGANVNAPPPIPAKVIARERDRKSTRLNSSHSQISYAVFCLKKKKIKISFRRNQFYLHNCHLILYSAQ